MSIGGIGNNGIGGVGGAGKKPTVTTKDNNNPKTTVEPLVIYVHENGKTQKIYDDGKIDKMVMVNKDLGGLTTTIWDPRLKD